MGKKENAGIWLKAIAAVISFIAGLITGGQPAVSELVDNVIGFVS